MDEEVKKKTRRKRVNPLKRLRYRGRLRKPGTSAAMKEKWKDPEYRARMAERRQKPDFTGRYGVPDGMLKADAYKLREEAKDMAEKAMNALEKAGALVDADAQAREALKTSLEIMLEPGDKKVRLAAAKQVLEFTKAKPASTSNVNLNAAEQWLKEIADDAEGGPQKTA